MVIDPNFHFKSTLTNIISGLVSGIRNPNGLQGSSEKKKLTDEFGRFPVIAEQDSMQSTVIEKSRVNTFEELSAFFKPIIGNDIFDNKTLANMFDENKSKVLQEFSKIVDQEGLLILPQDKIDGFVEDLINEMDTPKHKAEDEQGKLSQWMNLLIARGVKLKSDISGLSVAEQIARMQEEHTKVDAELIELQKEFKLQSREAKINKTEGNTNGLKSIDDLKILKKKIAILEKYKDALNIFSDDIKHPMQKAIYNATEDPSVLEESVEIDEVSIKLLSHEVRDRLFANPEAKEKYNKVLNRLLVGAQMRQVDTSSDRLQRLRFFESLSSSEHRELSPYERYRTAHIIAEAFSNNPELVDRILNGQLPLTIYKVDISKYNPDELTESENNWLKAYGGFYDGRTNALVLKSTSEDTLVHEFAHAIDDIDGLDGDVGAMASMINEEGNSLFSEFKYARGKLSSLVRDYEYSLSDEERRVLDNKRAQNPMHIEPAIDLPYYVLQDDAEFFAEVTRRFFSNPELFFKENKNPQAFEYKQKLYNVLREFYGYDPYSFYTPPQESARQGVNSSKGGSTTGS